MSGSSGPLRAKRYLVFPRPGSYTPTKVQLILGIGLPMEVDVSTIMGYVVKFNYNLPYNASTLTDPYVRHERSPVEGPGSSFQPREGRPCLLKAVCEAADVPFNGNHGVLGELLQVLLTPSSTSDGQENVDDQEYRAAEILGREHPGQCGRIFSDCDSSLLEYFSEVF
ncbi:uncharacterized protein LOC105701924 [Orussus abietinus]|uniref:uncharacterized protein LOC105701924 n=1 Tax=Orussus abietinus TaxID=222816 RepID=UPI000C71623D|nr:uncharacterized protein LOC105701924 [Orussus abietinus]